MLDARSTAGAVTLLHFTEKAEDEEDGEEDRMETEELKKQRFVIGWTSLNVLYSHSIASYSDSSLLMPLTMQSHVHFFSVELRNASYLFFTFFLVL